MSAFVLLLACAPTKPGPDGDDTGGATDTAPTAPAVTVGAWSDCELVPGSGDTDAECAVATLPWDPDDPSLGAFEALVKRVPARVEPAAGQVWVLHGGPGASAVDDLAYLPSGLLEARPDLAVYAVDHRGVGGTVPLRCPDQEGRVSDGGVVITDAEYPACVTSLEATWGEWLDQITTTRSATDVAGLIDVLRGPEEPVFVYGGSYGTYLGQRYLQLRPDQPTGVILDGVVNPGLGLREYDANMDGAGRALLAACAADVACAGHFDGDPLAVAEGLAARFDEGHCGRLGVDGDFVRYFLGVLLMYDKVRDLVPAVVHRMDRCDADDVDTIVRFYTQLAAIGGASLEPPAGDPGAGDLGTGFSYPLFYHVALSEMWYPEGEVDLDGATEAWRTRTFATGLETWLAARSPGWPRYPEDPLAGAFAAYTGPLLLLQGGLDPATTAAPAQEVAAHFTGPHQWLAFVPQGAHGIVNGATLPDGSDCGDRIFEAFLSDPEAELDLSCIAQVLPVQFDGYEDYNTYFFGSQDVWGDGAAR